MIVNLKNGYGGWTIDATSKPISEPDMAAITTLTGINHLHNEREKTCKYQYIRYQCITILYCKEQQYLILTTQAFFPK